MCGKLKPSAWPLASTVSVFGCVPRLRNARWPSSRMLLPTLTRVRDLESFAETWDKLANWSTVTYQNGALVEIYEGVEKRAGSVCSPGCVDMFSACHSSAHWNIADPGSRQALPQRSITVSRRATAELQPVTRPATQRQSVLESQHFRSGWLQRVSSWSVGSGQAQFRSGNRHQLCGQYRAAGTDLLLCNQSGESEGNRKHSLERDSS